jgi:hypothetical protein
MVSFTGEFLPNFELKNTISTYRKDFSLVKMAQKFTSLRIKKKFQIARVLFDNFQKVAKKYKKDFFF